ncbi:MAG: hypothetical protein N2C14_21130, partial [Planctomycetales bacterium]
MKRLTADPQVKPLVPQFVAFELKIDDPQYTVWKSRYKPAPGSVCPKFFLISSQGQQLVSKHGAPSGADLRKLLLFGIQQTGGFKQTYEEFVREKKLSVALRNAKRLLARNETADSVSQLLPFMKNQPQPVSTENQGAADVVAAAKAAIGKSKVQKEFEALVVQFHETAQAQLTEAANQFASDKPLEGFLATIRARRRYGQLSAITEAVDAILAEQGEDSIGFAQAELLDGAQQQEAAKQPGRSVSAYQKVIDAFPHTPVAEASAERIAELTGAAVARIKPQLYRGWTVAAGKVEIEAMRRGRRDAM